MSLVAMFLSLAAGCLGGGINTHGRVTKLSSTRVCLQTTAFRDPVCGSARLLRGRHPRVGSCFDVALWGESGELRKVGRARRCADMPTWLARLVTLGARLVVWRPDPRSACRVVRAERGSVDKRSQVLGRGIVDQPVGRTAGM